MKMIHPHHLVPTVTNTIAMTQTTALEALTHATDAYTKDSKTMIDVANVTTNVTTKVTMDVTTTTNETANMTTQENHKIPKTTQQQHKREDQKPTL